MPSNSSRKTLKSRRASSARGRTIQTMSNGMTITRVPVRSSVVTDVSETTVSYTATYKGGGGTALSPSSEFYTFQGNSVFNPDLNVLTENYPIGHPQWAQLYNRFQVIGSEMKVMMHSVDTLNLSSIRAVIWAKPYSSSLPAGAISVDTIVGNPHTSAMELVGPVSGKSISKMGMRMQTSTILARPDSQNFCSENQSGYCLSGAFAPDSAWFWIVFVTNAEGSPVEATAVSLTFTVKYRVRYYQPHGVAVLSHSLVGAVPPSNTKDVLPCLCDEAEEKHE